MTDTPQSPQKLHLVSEVLLKQWSQPVPTNKKQIRSFVVASRKMSFSSPRETCYTEDLITIDSQVFEDTWQSVENRVAPVLAKINDGLQPDDSSFHTLIEFLAVHLT